MSSLKTQFEDYGETLYIRLSNEFSDSISRQLQAIEEELSGKLRRDGKQLIMEGLRSLEKSCMLAESKMEDLKIT